MLLQISELSHSHNSSLPEHVSGVENREEGSGLNYGERSLTSERGRSRERRAVRIQKQQTLCRIAD